ncbi:MAG: hypothetical protein LBB43_02250 [Spirochaetaceae bacterium]|nr:hypothetical protein [Spirochaetaceae bacterium]
MEERAAARKAAVLIRCKLCRCLFYGVLETVTVAQLLGMGLRLSKRRSINLQPGVDGAV